MQGDQGQTRPGTIDVGRNRAEDDMSESADARGCRILRNVAVPMRDGARLATSVYLPVAEGPFPAVLTVYYEPGTLVGLKKGANRDFARGLARRGFVT